jgi:rsbT co-antagonist protein RsbR
MAKAAHEALTLPPSSWFNLCMTSPPVPGQFEIDVGGLVFDWDLEAGVFRIAGIDAVALWAPSTMAGLMLGLQRMVGTERFNLCMLAGGCASIESDWQYICNYPTFEEGFAALSLPAASAGWGRWRIVSVDRAAKKAVFHINHNWECIYQKALGLGWGSYMTGGKLVGYCAKLFDTTCGMEQTRFEARGDDRDEFVIQASDFAIDQQIEKLLWDGTNNADLAVVLERLRQENQRRQTMEEELRRHLEIVQQQKAQIQALTTPIVQVWKDVLALPVIGALDAGRAAIIMDRLLQEIGSTQSRFAIIDLTAVEVIDSAAATHLLQIIRAVSLLGATGVATGIRPGIAQTMVSLGVDLSGIVTLATMQDGLQYCIRHAGE